MPAARAAQAALMAFLVLVPWGPALWVERTGHDTARLLQMLLWALCGVALAAGGGLGLGGRWARWAGLGVLSAALALAARAPQPVWAGLEVALWTGMVAVAMLVAEMAQRDGAWRCALAWALLTAALLQGTLEVLLALLGLLQGIAPSAGLVGSGYDNLRFFNHVQTISLPLAAMAPAWLARQRSAQAMAWWALATGGAALWASGGRATLLGLSVGLVVATLFSGREGWPTLRRALLALPMALLLYWLVWRWLPDWTGAVSGAGPEGAQGMGQRMAASVNDNARLTLWLEALAQWRSSPWLGIGPMHLAQWPNPLAMHPHQWLLQGLAEWGGLFMLAVSGLGLAWLGRCWTRGRALTGTDRAAATGAWWAVVASLVDAQFSGNAVMPVSQVWLAVAWGSLHGCCDRGTPSPGGQAAGRIARGLACALLLASLWPVLRQWPDLEARLAAIWTDHFVHRTQPRFWSHGELFVPRGVPPHP